MSGAVPASDAVREHALLGTWFHRLRVLGDAERQAELSALASTSPALAAELVALLEADQRAGALFESRSGESVGADAPPIASGGQFGEFRILRRLGAGGMGVVDLAEQREPKRLVALKRLRADCATEDGLARLRREAQVLARLDHPGIARLLDFGVEPAEYGPQPWMALQFVDGQPFDRATVGWSLERILRLFANLADAVQTAHAAGIVHRDLKCANVLVTPEGRPVVLDFGVAALLGDQEDDPLRTRTGVVLGTLVGMAPEQTLGRRAAVDARADVYAIGVMLYERLTGTLPVEVRDVSPGEALRRIREEEPRPMGTLTRGLATDVSTIVHTALAKEPGRRYADAGALRDDLLRFLEHRPIAARPASTLYLAARLVRRNAKLFGAIAMVLLALLVGFTGALVAMQKARAAEAATRLVADLEMVGALERTLPKLLPAVPEKQEEIDFWLAQARALGPRIEPRLRGLDPEVDPNAPVDERIERERLLAAAQFFDPNRALGGFRDMERRSELARNLHRRSIEDHRSAWNQAIAAIATSAHYGGLRMPAQLGLVPLGPDPRSGLLEFAHVGGSGEIPWRDSASGELAFGESSAIVLVLIPGGRQMVGRQAEDINGPLYDPDAQDHERPVSVHLDPYFVGKYPVTAGQWKRIRGSVPSYYWPTWGSDGWNADYTQPVDSIDWQEALNFAVSQDLTLPTDAQFEVALRGNTVTEFWTGTDPDGLRGKEHLNSLAHRHTYSRVGGVPHVWPGKGFTAPAGIFAPNPFGLYDMAGNLNQWCLDRYLVTRLPGDLRPGDGLHGADVPPPAGRLPHRAVRGAYHSPPFAASGRRNDELENTRSRRLGMRVARSLDAVERGAKTWHRAPETLAEVSR